MSSVDYRTFRQCPCGTKTQYDTDWNAHIRKCEVGKAAGRTTVENMDYYWEMSPRALERMEIEDMYGGADE